MGQKKAYLQVKGRFKGLRRKVIPAWRRAVRSQKKFHSEGEVDLRKRRNLFIKQKKD